MSENRENSVFKFSNVVGFHIQPLTVQNFGDKGFENILNF